MDVNVIVVGLWLWRQNLLTWRLKTRQRILFRKHIWGKSELFECLITFLVYTISLQETRLERLIRRKFFSWRVLNKWVCMSWWNLINLCLGMRSIYFFKFHSRNTFFGVSNCLTIQVKIVMQNLQLVLWIIRTGLSYTVSL